MGKALKCDICDSLYVPFSKPFTHKGFRRSRLTWLKNGDIYSRLRICDDDGFVLDVCPSCYDKALEEIKRG